MTPAELDAIEARVRSITPGLMESNPARVNIAVTLHAGHELGSFEIGCLVTTLEHALPDLAALVAEVRRLQKENDELWSEVHTMRENYQGLISALEARRG